jgi:hypothetical protein
MFNMLKSFPFRIFIVALVLRLIPILLTCGLGIGLDDMFQYDMLARSLAGGHGFRWYAQADLQQLASFVHFDLASVKDYDPNLGIFTSFRAPLYPAFLAIVYFFSGTGFSRFLAARVAQTVFLGAPLAPLTYWVAKRLFGIKELAPENSAASRLAPKISAWIVAAYPLLLIYPLGLGTENPFFVLLLTSFLFLLKITNESKGKDSFIFHPSTFIFSGFFLGLTALTRSVILPFVGLAVLWVWFSLKQKRGAVILALAFTLTITPWVVRNSLLHHKLTGIETSMGYNLYLGYHPKGNGSFVFGPSLDLLTIMDDAARDKVGTQKAIEFIKAQPERFVPLAVNRLGFFFGLEKRVLMYFYSNDILGFIPLPLLLTISAVLLLPFVLISVSADLGFASLKRTPQTELLFLLFAAYILPHVFILAEDRFHLALVPYIAILAAHFWTNGFGDWQSRSGKILLVVGVACAILLLLNWGVELHRDWDKIVQLLGPNGNHSNFSY